MVRVTCLLICSYYGKYVQVFPPWHCNPAIGPYSSKQFYGSSSSSRTKTSVFGTAYPFARKIESADGWLQNHSNNRSILFRNITTLSVHLSLIGGCADRDPFLQCNCTIQSHDAIPQGNPRDAVRTRPSAWGHPHDAIPWRPQGPRLPRRPRWQQPPQQPPQHQEVVGCTRSQRLAPLCLEAWRWRTYVSNVKDLMGRGTTWRSTCVLWWGEKLHVWEQAHSHPVAIAQSPTQGSEARRLVYEKRAEVSIWWRGVCCSWWFRLSAEKCINREFSSCI